MREDGARHVASQLRAGTSVPGQKLGGSKCNPPMRENGDYLGGPSTLLPRPRPPRPDTRGHPLCTAAASSLRHTTGSLKITSDDIGSPPLSSHLAPHIFLVRVAHDLFIFSFFFLFLSSDPTPDEFTNTPKYFR